MLCTFIIHEPFWLKLEPTNTRVVLLLEMACIGALVLVAATNVRQAVSTFIPMQSTVFDYSSAVPR